MNENQGKDIEMTENEVLGERRELNRFLFRQITAMRNEIQFLGTKTTSIETNQTCVVMPNLNKLAEKIDNLDKRIRGNGKPGYDQRIDCLEKTVKEHEDDLNNKEDGVIPYIIETKTEKRVSFHWATIVAGVVGSALTILAAFLITPIGTLVCNIFKSSPILKK